MQRDFYRIIRTIGTPAISPKPRGFGSGRVPGDSKEKRKRYPVIKKVKKMKKNPSPTQTAA
ncbi:hypothetical protein ACE1CI_19115 [Aerosakkonemataceae cyanobacterium BLCC-F50]|uniref:Ribosomal protein S18 n=1 Tax=Floridaenema flaviceps BLCC-F50 TaxID=3153642 RepID=A0ABV4XUS3_9CYAN